MGKQVQLLRGTTAENNIFTGEEGALTYNTETKAIVVHDGQTQGGGGFIDTVVEFQLPTEENDYTWYRKYASGWVEQGGYVQSPENTGQAVTLPVTMLDAYYQVMVTASCSAIRGGGTSSVVNRRQGGGWAYSPSVVYVISMANESASTTPVYWQVSGMAADASQSDTPEEPSVLPSQ